MQTTWHNYGDVYGYGDHHTVVGNLKVAKDVYSAHLHNYRHIIVYLPPSYCHGEKRYPVLYMHDGQNLFDNATSYVGEWGVDETMERLSIEENLEAIVVGIPNTGHKRVDEYSPFRGGQGGGRANDYLAFISHVIKPMVDETFRTMPDKRHTGLLGSSMGGLVSLYGFFHRADVFGFAGVMSPSLWYAQGAIFSYVEAAIFHPGKIYLDVGTREHGDSWAADQVLRRRSRQYYAQVRRLKRILAKKGYRPTRTLVHVEEKWANHSESAWGRRLPRAIRFFLGSG